MLLADGCKAVGVDPKFRGNLVEGGAANFLIELETCELSFSIY